MSNEREEDGVVRGWGEGPIPTLLGVIAAVYFIAVWSEAAIRSGIATRWLSNGLGYFAQIATLFPGPTQHAIDYRVEGYRCSDQTWVELDVSPYFPIDAGNKENRFYRAIHFYGDQHPHRPTLRALDEFIVARYDRDVVEVAAQGRGGDSIGGVRFVRLRLAFGKPGDGSARYEAKPLGVYTPAERTDLYYTPESKRQERCARSGR